MDKKRVSVEKYFDQRRCEIINKFSVDESIKKEVIAPELMFIIKMVESKNAVINNRKPIVKQVKLATLEEKRSEIIGKFSNDRKNNLSKQEKVEFVENEVKTLVNVGDIDSYFEEKRSEIIDKFAINNEIQDQLDEEKIVAIIEKIKEKNEEISRRKPIVKQVKLAILEDKRSEIVGKFVGFEDLNVNKIQDKKVETDEKEEVVKEKLYENVSLGSIEEHLKQKRSEIINKFDVKKDINKDISEKELISIIKEIEEKNEEVSKREPVKKDIKIATLEEKRSEIVDKFTSKYNNENVLKEKVGVEESEEIKKIEGMTLEEINEQKLEELEDEVQENVENISIVMIIVIVLVCAIVGTIIGYILYKLAMNNSNATAMIFRYFI